MKTEPLGLAGLTYHAMCTKTATLVLVLVSLMAAPVRAQSELLASSLDDPAGFSLKGAAWGRVVRATDELVVQIDSLTWWRDPTRGRGGDPNNITTVLVELSSGSLVTRWSVVARSRPRSVEQVLALDESLWIRAIEFTVPLPDSIRDQVDDYWLTFTAWDRTSRSLQHFHAPARFSGEANDSFRDMPAGFEEHVSSVFSLNEITGGRHISIPDVMSYGGLIERLARAAATPICSDESATSPFSKPSFRIRGFEPRDERQFIVRIARFAADGTYDGLWSVQVARSDADGWRAAIDEFTPMGPPSPSADIRPICFGN